MPIAVREGGKGTYSLRMTDASAWDILTKIAEVTGMDCTVADASEDHAAMIILEGGGAAD